MPTATPGGPLRLRLHRPFKPNEKSNEQATELSALVYLHGGGGMLCDLNQGDRLAREIAARSGRMVIGMGRNPALASQPADALDQALGVWRWAHAEAFGLRIDPERIALGGDAAGASLALATALALRDARGAQPDALLLDYAACTGAASDPPPLALSARSAPRPLFRGLPCCCLVVADRAERREDLLALAGQLRGAGVAVALQGHPGPPRGFREAMAFRESSHRALDQCCEWLRRALW